MNNWIEFDKNDKSTWPTAEQCCLIHEKSYGSEGYRLYDTVFQIYEGESCFYGTEGNDRVDTTTHWQPLPEPPTN